MKICFGAKVVSQIGPGRIKLATKEQQAAAIVGPEARPYRAVEGEEAATGGDQ